MTNIKKERKKVIFEQILLMIFAALYLIESIFLRGLFTNLPLVMATLVIGIIVIIVSLVKKQYKWAFLDLLICLVCFGIAVYLYSL